MRWLAELLSRWRAMLRHPLVAGAAFAVSAIANIIKAGNVAGGDCCKSRAEKAAALPALGRDGASLDGGGTVLFVSAMLALPQ